MRYPTLNLHHIIINLLNGNKNLDLSKEIVLFCAAGGRSALAAKTLKEMGFEKVSHVEGGFGLMQHKGFKVV